MTDDQAVDRLIALAQETRLRLFRLLVETGSAGLNAGALATALGIAPATLSFHVAHLVRAGLVSARQEGRYIFYAVCFSAMDELIVYLTANCCQGQACLPGAAALATPVAPLMRKPAMPFNILVLCTGNSARSILGEMLFNHLGQGRVRAFSAGSKPIGVVNPVAIETLQKHGVPCEGARSKSWDEFAAADAPHFDFIFTVCDNAAHEPCPIWSGQPTTAHWGLPDPAHVEPLAARRAAFEEAFQSLQQRITAFLALPLEILPPEAILAAARRIHTGESTMNVRPMNVLFLCTGNSARSILAEAILNAMGQGRFRAFSAGSHPTGMVNPLAIELLKKNHLPTEKLRSKSWDEFAAPGAPELDFVFTVCDKAASEVCPVWPGQPLSAHWGVPDPAAVEGDDEKKHKAFFAVFHQLQNRISLFVNLPLAKLDKLTLKQRLDEIGQA